jgi:hypothetical protein
MERIHAGVTQCPFGLLSLFSIAALAIAGGAYALLG